MAVKRREARGKVGREAAEGESGGGARVIGGNEGEDCNLERES